MIAVRIATGEDIDTLVRLNTSIQSVHALLASDLFLPETKAQEVAQFFTEKLADEKHEAAIALLNEDPVGYALIEMTKREASTFTHAIHSLHIHHLSVEERARRKGVASALMNWAEQRAQELGIGRLFLHHVAGNEAARRFYEAQGYGEEHVTRAKRIGGGGNR